MKRFIRIFLIILALLLLSILVFLPYGIRLYSVANSEKFIGRAIDLESLRVNYLSGKIKMKNFSLYEANGRDIFLGFDTLVLDLRPFKLLSDELNVQEFYLSGLHTSIELEDSTFNFDDMVEYLSSQNDTLIETEVEDSIDFVYHLSNITLHNGSMIFQNFNVNDTIVFDSLHLNIPYIGFDQNNISEAGMVFQLGNGGLLDSDVLFDPLDGELSAKFRLKAIDLVNASKHLSHYSNLKSLAGELNSTIEVKGNINEPEQMIISGRVGLNELALEDSSSRKFFTAGAIKVDVNRIDIDNAYYELENITVTRPYIFFEQKDSINNIMEIFGIEADTSTEESMQNENVLVESAPGDAFFYRVNSFVMEEGVIDFNDILEEETFTYNLSKITINADSIASTSDSITIYADMLLNDRGKLRSELSFDPTNFMDMGISYSVTDFNLADLHIYSTRYTGFPVNYGNLIYKGNTVIREGQLSSENKLIIEHVELGSKKGGLYDLPLKFALFILKDPNDNINLDIPVRGDLNDPSVKIGKIVWNTLKNLVLRVASTPYEFMAGLVGADPHEIEMIEFNYLDTTLSEQHQNQLDLLLELEKVKENLAIDLVYFNDTAESRDRLALREAGQIFTKETGKDYEADHIEFDQFLDLKTGADSLGKARKSRLLLTHKKVDSLAVAYRQIRIQKIQDYLSVAGSDSTGIEIVMTDPASPKNQGSPPVFEVKYSMLREE